MSNPSFESENAAAPALVSDAPSHARAAPSEGEGAAPAANPRAVHTDAATGTARTGTPTVAQGGLSVAPRMQSQPLSSHTASHIALPAANLAEDPKKLRPSTNYPKQSGPSLLTQQLNSARGIARATGQKNQEAIPASIALSEPDNAIDCKPGSKGTTSGSLETAVVETDDDVSLPSSDDGVVTPRGSPRSATMATISTTTALPANAGESTFSISPAHRLDAKNLLIQIREQKGAAGLPGGSSSPDTPTQSKPRELLIRANTLPSSEVGQITESPTALDYPFAQSRNRGGEAAITQARPARPRMMEHRLSMGPEKAWSISSAKVADGQDGQVEKSIKDVLSGAEHDRGSRKASHSMRFFKDSQLPEKLQRRDTRIATPHRTADTALDTISDIGEIPTEGAGPFLAEEPLRRPTKSLPVTAVSAFSTVDKTRSGTGKIQAEEYADDRGEAVHETTRGPPLVLSAVSAGREDAELDVAGVQPEAECQREQNESVEEGEDSGEEKISSAVFLPHQALDDAGNHAQPGPGAQKRLVSGTVPQSPDGDFHPWLVKADEPEADDPAVETSDLDPRKRQQHGSDHGAPGKEAADKNSAFPSVHTDRRPHEDQAARLSQPVSEHYETHVHDHQIAPSQPLDAIELIPYKHQVGGHTTLWRFSKRAVCKQLNNRENEFYETIEKYHKDLLPFLPRYADSLDVMSFHR